MSTRPVSPALRHLPNALTVLRLVALPVFAVLLLADRTGPSWAGKQGEANTGGIGEPDDPIQRRYPCVIRARGVVGQVI